MANWAAALNSLGHVAGQAGTGYMKNMQTQLEQAYKQFQMEKTNEEMSMRRDMHEIEKQKLDMILKQEANREKLNQSPAKQFLKMFGVDTENMSDDVTMEQAATGGKIAIPFLEQKSKAEDRQQRNEDRDLDRGFKIFSLDETMKQREADRLSREQMHKDSIENQRTLKSMVGQGKERKPHEIGKDAAGLRKEMNNLPEVKERNAIQPKLASMESAWETAKKTNNFVAVDQSLITLFNKLTDPSSVVRESEYARTAMNLPFFNAIKGKVEKFLKGGAGLTTDDRAKLLEMGRLIKKGYEDIYNRRAKEYREYATMQGLDPNMVAKEDMPSSQPSGAWVQDANGVWVQK